MSQYYLIFIPISALFITQAIKLSVDSIKGNFTWYHLINDYGGMPSSHSAFVSAIATEIALTQHGGIKSPLFAITLFLAIIVIRNAKGIRNDISKANQEINKLSNNKVNLKERLGHTSVEIFIGCVIGIIIAVIGVFLV
ncbi:divergent PAP2 family protein [Patescibacteria group bacterium]